MPNNISNSLRRFQEDIRKYAQTEYPGMAGKKTLRFIDDNFRSQSWAGLPTIAWHRRRNRSWTGKKNEGRAILVQRGILRRSFRMQPMNAAVRVYTDVAYAKAHNEGFNGIISQNVRSYKRKLTKLGIVSRTERKRVSNVKYGRVKTGETTVAAHTRKIRLRLPRRQFMPTAESPSSVLTASIKRQTTLDILKIKNRYGSSI